MADGGLGQDQSIGFGAANLGRASMHPGLQGAGRDHSAIGHQMPGLTEARFAFLRKRMALLVFGCLPCVRVDGGMEVALRAANNLGGGSENL